MRRPRRITPAPWRRRASLAPAPEPGPMARLHKSTPLPSPFLTEYEAAVAEYQRALELIRLVEDRRREIEILGWAEHRIHIVSPSGASDDIHRPSAGSGTRVGRSGLPRRLSGHPGAYPKCQLRADPRSHARGRGGAPPCQSGGDPKLLARALSNLGATLQWRADFDRGLAYLHEGGGAGERAARGIRVRPSRHAYRCRQHRQGGV